MLNTQLQRTQSRLLNAVNSATAPKKIKKLLYYLIKTFNLQRAYHDWQSNGCEDEGFQYIIIDGIKANAVRICKNIDVVELDTLITDIVFAEIPS